MQALIAANASIRRPARPCTSLFRIAFTIAKKISGVATALISWMTSLPSSPSGAARGPSSGPTIPPITMPMMIWR